jgi:hypothetical protein
MLLLDYSSLFVHAIFRVLQRNATSCSHCMAISIKFGIKEGPHRVLVQINDNNVK